MRVVKPSASHAEPEPEDEIAALVAKSSKGDEQAFHELYDLTASWVYGVSLRVLRDPAQSE
jgi:RNA polymerase sigma-70 factor (ECF subfamily)